MSLLEVRDLHTSFFTDAGEVKAVNGVSFDLDRGQTLGIFCGHDSHLRTICVNHTHFLVLDLLVDKQFLVADSSTPP